MTTPSTPAKGPVLSEAGRTAGAIQINRCWTPEQMAQWSTAPNGVHTWAGYRAVESTNFAHNGRTYIVKRDAATKEFCALSKRTSTNRAGVGYDSMNIKGKAGRLVLAALRVAGAAP